MALIVPLFAETADGTVTIDGATYRPALVGADGRLSIAVNSSALPSGAATAARQDTMITALQLIDDLRNALAAVATDRLLVNVFATGASEVKAALTRTVSPSTTRVTVATPAAGKKIRLIACSLRSSSTTVAGLEVYFGIGASIATTPTKAISEIVLQVTTVPSLFAVWPDGGGPIGAADDVLSFRTSADIAANASITVHYREE